MRRESGAAAPAAPRVALLDELTHLDLGHQAAVLRGARAPYDDGAAVSAASRPAGKRCRHEA